MMQLILDVLLKISPVSGWGALLPAAAPLRTYGHTHGFTPLSKAAMMVSTLAH
ncbi:TPA: hypothetical protein MB363_004910 [Klebsiella quasipneumoniae subsp. similipneumoniae]|nr:hypothetical protein [Klebsiella quasipneumoniae subsp. similipneumoniae]